MLSSRFAIFEFGHGFYGNTYISVLSTFTLTPTVRLPTATAQALLPPHALNGSRPRLWRDEQLDMKSYKLLDLQYSSAVLKCLITPPHLSDQRVFQFPSIVIHTTVLEFSHW